MSQGRSAADGDRTPLRRLVADSERPSAGLAGDILQQIADALAQLHAAQRSAPHLRPETLFLRRTPDGRPHLHLGAADAPPPDDAAALVERMRYQAPEQFDERGVRGPAGDIYAWGLVAYELLTGSFPISGESASSLIAGHLFRPPLPFDDADPDGRVPDGLRRLVSSTLAKEPDERPPIGDVAERLRKLRRDLPAPEPSELDRWLGSPRRAGEEPEASEANESDDDAQPLEHAPTVTLDPSAIDAAAERARSAPDVDALVATAREQARSEEFVDARDTLQRVLRHEPEHAEARRLLASVEACLKIQLEESKAHETVRLPPRPGTESGAENAVENGAGHDVRPGGGENETVRLHAGSETATVRMDTEPDETRPDETRPDETDAGGHTRPLPPDLLEEARQAPPPGTVTVPMESVQAAKDRQAAAPSPASFDDEGVGHPTSFGRAPEPQAPPEEKPPEEPSAAPSEPPAAPSSEPPPAPSEPPAPPPSTAPSTAPSTPSPPSAPQEGLSDLGFGDRDAGYQGGRPRSSNQSRKPSPLDAQRSQRGRGAGWLVASLVAALLVFAVGYVISSGVDPLSLFGAGEAEEAPIVPPAETPPAATAQEPGILRLDAEPWAEIVEIRDALGERATLRVEHTPAHIALAPGRYSVILQDPVSGERQTLEVELASGENVSRRAVLRDVDVDDYFRQMDRAPGGPP